MKRIAAMTVARLAVRGFLVVGLAILVHGCTKPSRYTDEDVKRYDEDTTYRITEVEKGFRILVNYEEYQFWPSRRRSHEQCRERLVWIARRHATDLDRKIVKIDWESIQVDSGRNILNGYTTCTATYDVEWLGPPRRNL